MIALIDGDILLYEIGFASEANWKYMKAQTHPEYEGPFIPPFEVAEEILERRIGNIMGVTGATSAIFFFTGKSNFRLEIARRRPYKERAGNKPFHYYNLKAYIKGKYECEEREGLEADDLICMYLTADPENTIACTRDKDLRSCEGNHYGWELGNQPQFGPLKAEGLGHIELDKKIKGYGKRFFYSQCLTGDSVDSVPGLPRCGPVNAFRILDGAESEQELYERVLYEYQKRYPVEGYSRLLEQARLLHMVRQASATKALMWSPPDYDKEDWIDFSTGQIEVRPRAREVLLAQ